MVLKIYDRTPEKSRLSVPFITPRTFLKNSRLILRTNSDSISIGPVKIDATPVHIGNWKVRKLAPRKWEVRYTSTRSSGITAEDLMDLGILAHNVDEIYLDSGFIEYSILGVIALVILAFLIGYLVGK